MTLQETLNMYKKKKDFIDNVGKIISLEEKYVESIRYDLYQSKHHDEWFYEYVVITYVGGSFETISVSCNSNMSNLKTISDHILLGHTNNEDMSEILKDNFELVVL